MSLAHLSMLSVTLLLITESRAQWPQFRGNPAHSAETELHGAQHGLQSWKQQTDGAVYASPSIADGAVYVQAYLGSFYAFNASSGDQLWKKASKKGSASSAAIVDGFVYFGATDGYLYKLDAKLGTESWKFNTNGFLFSKSQIVSSPTVVNGTVYFGCDNKEGAIYAVDVESGKQKWKVTTGAGAVGGGVPGSPAVFEGTVFIGANDKNLYAIDASTGEIQWKFATQDIVYSSPAVSSDGKTVYVGSNDGNTYAISTATGMQSWATPTVGWVDSSPAIGDGVVFSACSNSNPGLNNTIAALNASTGESLWKTETGDASDILARLFSLETTYYLTTT